MKVALYLQLYLKKYGTKLMKYIMNEKVGGIKMF